MPAAGRGPKDRSADLLFAVALHAPNLERIRTNCRSLPVDRRLEFAADPARYLPERAVAAWYASGVEPRGERRVGVGDLGGLMRVYARLGAPPKLLDGVAIAARKTREPITVFLPFLWLVAAAGETSVVDHPLAQSGSVNGVPVYALDKHTRLGRQAIQRFGRENAEIARFVNDYAPYSPNDGALRMAVFCADSALTRRSLRWRQSAELETLGVAADFHSVNAAAVVGAALIQARRSKPRPVERDPRRAAHARPAARSLTKHPVPHQPTPLPAPQQSSFPDLEEVVNPQTFTTSDANTYASRRYFIGGSDARIIMGADEAALVRLWKEKRGEAEPEDLSANLIVQLGVVTEALNRAWYERNTGRTITDIQRRVRHPVNRWMAATLDGMVEGIDAVFEAKFMLPWSFSEETAAQKHMAQLQHNMWVTNAKSAALSIVTGGGKWVEITIQSDALYQHFLLTAERNFWRCVQTGALPHPFGAEPPQPRIEAVQIVDMSASNSWAQLAGLFRSTRPAFLDHERAKAELKGLMPDDAKEASGHGIRAKRSKSGAVSFDLLVVEDGHAAFQ